MTPKQMIREATDVFVTFGVANAGDAVDINITKREALRLIDAHSLPANDSDHEIGSVGMHKGTAVITFHT